jgi:hypothetical protein
MSATDDDARATVRARRAEHCFALSRDALAAGIALVDADPDDHFDTWQLLEYNVLVAVARWAAAMLAVPREPTEIPVRPLPPGVVLPESFDPSSPPETWPPGIRPA